MKQFLVFVLFGFILLGKAYASHGDPCECNFHDVQPSFWVPTFCSSFVEPASCNDGPTPPSNSSPVLSNITNKTNTVGDTANFSASATDADGDTLTFSRSSFPNGANISPSGRVTGTLNTAGTFNSTVTVSDGNGGTDSDSFTWTVNAATNPDPDPTPPNCVCPFPTGSFYCGTLWTRPAECDGTPGPDPDPTPSNRAPVMSNITNQTNQVGDAINLRPTATDADGDTLSWSVSTLPNGVSINTSNGRITGTTTTVGTFNSSVTVRDNNGGSDIDRFTWNVSAASLPSCDTVCDDFNNQGNNMMTETRRCNDGTVDTDKVCGMPEMPTNDETLRGVDQDADGVRDDAEIWIMRNTNDIAQRSMYADMAKQYQRVLENSRNAAITTEALNEINMLNNCFTQAGQGSAFLLPLMVNNRARFVAYYEQNNYVTSKDIARQTSRPCNR